MKTAQELAGLLEADLVSAAQLKEFIGVERLLKILDIDVLETAAERLGDTSIDSDDVRKLLCDLNETVLYEYLSERHSLIPIIRVYAANDAL